MLKKPFRARPDILVAAKLQSVILLGRSGDAYESPENNCKMFPDFPK